MRRFRVRRSPGLPSLPATYAQADGLFNDPPADQRDRKYKGANAKHSVKLAQELGHSSAHQQSGFYDGCGGETVGFAKSPTASVPNTPFTRCTEVAPTGSSMCIRSKNSTAKTTRMPAMTPMMNELPILTNAQGAVMATRPANPPFRVMLRSGLPPMNHIINSALMDAVAAAVFVVTAMCAIDAQSAAIVEPGLNPNQPNHSTKTPIVADVILCP